MADQSAIFSPSSWTNVLPIEELFEHKQPLEVDLGCGKGRFLLAHAQHKPNVNFLGVDRQLARLRKIDKRIQKIGIANVRLLRIEAVYAVRFLLPQHSVTVLYLFFPDPWPKRRHHKRRLFNAQFLDALDKALNDNGKIHLATDHLGYFHEMRSLLEQDTRFREIAPFIPPETEKTDFEMVFQNQNTEIGRASFQKTTSHSPSPLPLKP
ncbi:MAG: tRNA (guanosine(46)-N7)-methyltransferase TrmB [Lentisphaerae bacterium]|nr:tRNA (guanosine(46)-N7)-methyltransferase TrmB [Lentisphaerota bacterium]